jgi:hypothetical protein
MPTNMQDIDRFRLRGKGFRNCNQRTVVKQISYFSFKKEGHSNREKNCSPVFAIHAPFFLSLSADASTPKNFTRKPFDRNSGANIGLTEHCKRKVN